MSGITRRVARRRRALLVGPGAGVRHVERALARGVIRVTGAVAIVEVHHTADCGVASGDCTCSPSFVLRGAA
jgi:hypothetical protein